MRGHVGFHGVTSFRHGAIVSLDHCRWMLLPRIHFLQTYDRSHFLKPAAIPLTIFAVWYGRS